jgi:hypothetical protein
MAEAVEVDMKAWLEQYRKTVKERTPWIPGLHEPVM